MNTPTMTSLPSGQAWHTGGSSTAFIQTPGLVPPEGSHRHVHGEPVRTEMAQGMVRDATEARSTDDDGSRSRATTHRRGDQPREPTPPLVTQDRPRGREWPVHPAPAPPPLAPPATSLPRGGIFPTAPGWTEYHPCLPQWHPQVPGPGPYGSGLPWGPGWVNQPLGGWQGGFHPSLAGGPGMVPLAPAVGMGQRWQGPTAEPQQGSYSTAHQGGDTPGMGYGAGAERGPQSNAIPGRRWAGMSESVALSRRGTETHPLRRGRRSVDDDEWQPGEGTPRLEPRNGGVGLTLPGLQERLDRVWEPRVYRSDYTKQELKLPKPFTGEARDGGPNLRAFWHDVRSMMVMWEENHWELRQFFLRMGPLMAGSAKEAYLELAEPLMRQGDVDMRGQPMLDERGRPVPLQDPVSHFFAELERRYPVSLREKSKEFLTFRRKHEEAPHACAARMKDLIQVLGMPDGPVVVSHFLAAWPEWSERAAELLGKRPGVPATLDRAAGALTTLTGPVEALKQSMFRPLYPPRQREERARVGGGSGAAGYRAETGEGGSRERSNQRCYNCQQPGHLARNCTEPPRDRWVDRPAHAGGTEAEEAELSTAELSRRMRRLQTELRRRRDAEGGNARLAVA